ncbi:MAG: RluA family pseudouridine synthase, partial [Gelidibacter sp.]|nr:RluA family pseudouridine synthase [Gelidibacter sp.]
MTDETNSIDDTDDELYEHYAFTADKGQTPLRIDKYLMNFIENATRNKIQAAAKNGSIYVNDVPVKSNYKVKPFDKIRVLFEHPPYEYLLTPENIPLDIVYEDDELLVINKEPGMVVHPGHGNYSGTLINALTYHFDNLPNNSSNRPGLVHRIDKDTSGLLVVAKTEEAMVHLSKQFFNKTSEREYVALVWGNMEEDEGTVEGHIGRHPKNRLQNTVFFGDDEDKGKPAVTHYKVMERLGYVTLVSCKLETGRTHQIRVHMK